MPKPHAMTIHRSANLDLPGIAHGFFGRMGGVSTGLYDSLNCGPGSADAPELVAENRTGVVAAIRPGARLATLAQIHSPIVHVVGMDWDESLHPQGDALVSAVPDRMLGILTADCAPVLFADPGARVIGAAHAGWKGALGGVLEATISAMERLGARRDDIRAAIGPCISQANYEVGPEFPAKVGDRRFFRPSDAPGRFRFDLAGFAADRLARAGIADIATLGLCTYPQDNGFFSFRRTTHRSESDYGREISVIVLNQQRPGKM
jgi:YfiH family protein